jgi:hypothetical protein
MGSFQRGILTLLLAALVRKDASIAQKFYADDPIERMPPPLHVERVLNREVNQTYDFLRQSIRPEMRPGKPAGGINTLGEVPDSEWFTNRHGKTKMSREQLQRGPANHGGPMPPFTVIGGKTEGVSPGFRIKDSRGHVYFVKVDPLRYPEMASASDVILSKFLYAIGYNTPANSILFARISDFTLADEAEIRLSRLGPIEKMTWGDLLDILNAAPRRPDGTLRLMASLAVEGEPIGPFRFEGTRRDDPNDIVPHENRRDLRGLFVFASWLNHTDSKAGNTLDALVEQSGVRFIRHYLIDFGAGLGSDSYIVKDPRFGHDFMFPRPGNVWRRMLRFGIVRDPWEKADYPGKESIGNFEAAVFHPENWKSNYPNPAFLSRLPDDEFWAAKIVMAFTDEDIRAIVETGMFSDPTAVSYITDTLIKRRNKIGRTYFSKVLPLDEFSIGDGKLQFEDLAEKYAFRPARKYRTRWFLFDNTDGSRSSLTSDGSINLLHLANEMKTGSYFGALISAESEDQSSITVVFRKTATGYQVVGVER